jgi:hypothetical protein
MFECNKCNSSVCGFLVYPFGQSSGASCLPDISTRSLDSFSRLLSNLSLLSRHDAISRQRNSSTHLLHDSYQPYNSGYRDCSSHRYNVCPCVSTRFRSSQEDRANHAAAMVLCVDYRRHRLPYALSDLSFLSEHSSNEREYSYP